MHWKIKDTRAADRTYFTTDCEYIITDEEQLNEKYSDVHYYCLLYTSDAADD